jgi:hypothetical protein
MRTDIIDHTTLAKMTGAGVSLTACAVRREGGWVALIRYGTSERALAVQRTGPTKVFAQLDQLAAYLHDQGVARFEVDTSPAAHRDRDAALEGAQTAAAYTGWLKAAIQDALDDHHATVPHDKAMRQVRAAIKAERP